MSASPRLARPRAGLANRRACAITHAALVGLLALAPTACDPPAPRAGVPILLFAGNGTSPEDVAAVERILDDGQVGYATATSRQLNRMSTSQLAAYRLVIVPGGNFIDMSASLAPRTTASLHDAVQGGLNYLGICAGAFLADDGGSAYNSVDLTPGVRFGFYSAERRGIRRAAVAVTGVGAPSLEQYWEDGPELTGWGAVVGKYPDGTPAVVEGTSGRGWVVLVGVHPEAPEAWRRRVTVTTPASVANAYAGTLIRAALTRTWLPHY
ncbi:MAG TPA: BPL-N domain-containing protein [Gemmatimonadaceae bacterium]|nr:BPL-N domain-containing protein [Gemmatimonadaceae bacterium]